MKWIKKRIATFKMMLVILFYEFGVCSKAEYNEKMDELNEIMDR